MNDEDITIIEGDDLAYLIDLANHVDQGVGGIYRLRIYRPKGGGPVKIKFNEKMWTPNLGSQGNN